MILRVDGDGFFRGLAFLGILYAGFLFVQSSFFCINYVRTDAVITGFRTESNDAMLDFEFGTPSGKIKGSFPVESNKDVLGGKIPIYYSPRSLEIQNYPPIWNVAGSLLGVLVMAAIWLGLAYLSRRLEPRGRPATILAKSKERLP